MIVLHMGESILQKESSDAVHGHDSKVLAIAGCPAGIAIIFVQLYRGIAYLQLQDIKLL